MKIKKNTKKKKKYNRCTPVLNLNKIVSNWFPHFGSKSNQNPKKKEKYSYRGVHVERPIFYPNKSEIAYTRIFEC